MMAIALLGGIGAAIALALLLDAIDGRIRYPEQVTTDLGLPIAAAIPKFPRGTVNTRSPEQVAHLVEAFRSLRMHIRHASATPITVAISSPQPGDGKSFVSANLAMSFADAGYRTILVDGDTRRGLAHEVFGLSMENGLTDYLAGEIPPSEIIRPTSHERLAFAPCGRRRPNSPELLTSAALPRLVDELRSRFDVVLFDTPPLNAGIDAYAISSALGNMVCVIRAGKTERRLAAAKLLLADRLPIQIVGAVLNAVQLDGEFAVLRIRVGLQLQLRSEKTKSRQACKRRRYSASAPPGEKIGVGSSNRQLERFATEAMQERHAPASLSLFGDPRRVQLAVAGNRELWDGRNKFGNPNPRARPV